MTKLLELCARFNSRHPEGCRQSMAQASDTAKVGKAPERTKRRPKGSPPTGVVYIQSRAATGDSDRPAGFSLQVGLSRVRCPLLIPLLEEGIEPRRYLPRRLMLTGDAKELHHRPKRHRIDRIDIVLPHLSQRASVVARLVISVDNSVDIARHLYSVCSDHRLKYLLYLCGDAVPNAVSFIHYPRQ